MKLVNHILSITKSRCNLRAFRAAASLIFLYALTSCEREQFNLPCETGYCEYNILSPTGADENGYIHTELDWTSEYWPYFTLDVEADRTADEYKYNGESVVQAQFDTDSYFILSDSLNVTINLYNPWQGLETWGGYPIPVRDTIVTLSQFEGYIVPVVQNTNIYFSEDEVGRFTTRRVVGPFPPTMIGDTITLYMKVKWDLGSEILTKDDFIQKFIIE